MSRTLSVTVDPDTNLADIGGDVLDDVRSLAERCREAVLYRLSEWFLDTNSGVDYRLIRGHQTSSTIAAQTITAAIRAEGGTEITGIDTPVVSFDNATRRFSYAVVIHSIYGEDISVNEVLVG